MCLLYACQALNRHLGALGRFGQTAFIATMYGIGEVRGELTCSVVAVAIAFTATPVCPMQCCSVLASVFYLAVTSVALRLLDAAYVPAQYLLAFTKWT